MGRGGGRGQGKWCVVALARCMLVWFLRMEGGCEEDVGGGWRVDVVKTGRVSASKWKGREGAVCGSVGLWRSSARSRGSRGDDVVGEHSDLQTTPSQKRV
jgi:hypothetical protein